MDQAEFNRLSWQCRRGMLELDIFLNRFLQEAYPHLIPADQNLFKELLQETDQDLFIWLTGREEPIEPNLKKIITMVRQHVNPES